MVVDSYDWRELEVWFNGDFKINGLDFGTSGYIYSLGYSTFCIIG